MYRSWTNEDLKNAVLGSLTKAEVLRKLGLKSHNSGNYQTIDKYIKELRLDTTHFIESSGEHKITKEYSLEEVLIENSPYSSTKNLKKKLLKANLLKNECYKCRIFEWQNQKLNLHLDHENGDRNDNRIENLRLLCPNCHSLTETYCRGKRRKKEYKCVDCGNILSGSRHKRCINCDGESKRDSTQKINWPELKNLIPMVQTVGFSGTAKKLGVSDNAVRKRIMSRENYNFMFQVSEDVGFVDVKTTHIHAKESVLMALTQAGIDHLFIHQCDLPLIVEGRRAYHRDHSQIDMIKDYDFSDICKQNRFCLTIKHTQPKIKK